MSDYDVVFTRRAAADFEEAQTWLEDRSLDAARKWVAALEQKIDLLEHDPVRFPPAREDPLTVANLRECHFGGGRRITHRLIFAIRPGKVVVYAIYHLSRKDLSLEDLLL